MIILHWNTENNRADDPFGVAISCKGDGFRILKNENKIAEIEKYLLMSLDLRLLKWLLQGPRKAHWSLVDIGCHIKYKRIPNTYERALYYCWNRFFASNSQE